MTRPGPGRLLGLGVPRLARHRLPDRTPAAAAGSSATPTRFDTVELNTTFYRLPTTTAVEHWAEQAPAGFVYAVKLGAFGSHRMKLRDAASWLPNHLDRVGRLGPALGPTLVQLPPRWRRNVATARRVPRARAVARCGGRSSCATRRGCTTTCTRRSPATAPRCASTTCSRITRGCAPPTGPTCASTARTPTHGEVRRPLRRPATVAPGRTARRVGR